MLVAKADQKTARWGRALEITLSGSKASSRSVLAIKFPTWLVAALAWPW